jgi:DNA-binding XRE family transcriptional regulator
MKISLTSARKNANLTMAKASKALGISSVTLRTWERGEAFPNVKFILKIEELYKIDFHDIYWAIK